MDILRQGGACYALSITCHRDRWLIVTGIALQIHFPSKQVAVADATSGVPVYTIQADYVKTLPEQEIPLP
jgi:hypothetical protein